jgi:hypothetical protein
MPLTQHCTCQSCVSQSRRPQTQFCGGRADPHRSRTVPVAAELGGLSWTRVREQLAWRHTVAGASTLPRFEQQPAFREIQQHAFDDGGIVGTKSSISTWGMDLSLEARSKQPGITSVRGTCSFGSVAVEFPADNTRHTIASSGEKSNPVEVRFDAATCRVYVHSVGSPLFTDVAPTWLVEYDLKQRRQVQDAVVDPQVLPPRCPEPR